MYDFQSEKDIQAWIFHEAVLLVKRERLSPKLHAEPTRQGARPGLVFGEDEVFVEIKLSEADVGGYTQAREKWYEDIVKRGSIESTIRPRAVFFWQ